MGSFYEEAGARAVPHLRHNRVDRTVEPGNENPFPPATPALRLVENEQPIRIATAAGCLLTKGVRYRYICTMIRLLTFFWYP